MMNLVHELGSYNHQRMRKHQEDWIAPVLLIGGFLGSGKTTLINQLLAQPAAGEADVLVREYGIASIDDRLIQAPEERIHSVYGVSIHIDEQLMLYTALDRLHEERFRKFDRLLLETSGIESPEYLVQLFFLWEMPWMLRLENTVIVVDAEYGLCNLEEYDIAAEQIAFADIVLINKTDLVSPEQLDDLSQRIRCINAVAKILPCSYGRVTPDSIRGKSLYEQLRDLPIASHVEGKNDMNKIHSVTLETDIPLDKKKVNAWIQKLFTDNGSKLLRSKGFFSFSGEDYRYEFQAVRKTYHSYANEMWADGEKRKTVIVLIGENLPERNILMDTLLECQ